MKTSTVSPSRLCLLLATATFSANILVCSSAATADHRGSNERGSAYSHDGRDSREKEREHKHLTDEREALNRQRDRYSDRNDGRSNEACPSGYQESEQKCSDQERRNGCTDVRLSNGRGCVKR